MRIDLDTPFAEKDAAKALGARWDSSRRTWYVQNVDDLAPFQRWIPAGAEQPAAHPAAVPARSPARATAARTAPSDKGTVTHSIVEWIHCGCDVLAWEPCTHHQ